MPERMPAAGPRTDAPPVLPPRRWVTALFCLLTMTWVLAYTPHPVVLAVVPAAIGWLAVMERSRSLREVMLWMLCFGAVAAIIGYRWLAQTIQDFGGVAPIWAWIGTALFGVWNTIHGWIIAIFYRALLARGRRAHPLLIVVMAVAAETLPIRMFPWLAGHGAVDTPPLMQAAEWGGVAGVSFVMYCLVIPLYEWLRWAFVRGGAKARPVAALVTFGIGLAFYGYGWIRYEQVRDEEAAATDHLRVGIVQANVGSSIKREATENGGRRRLDSIARYRKGTERAAAAGAELIVWPESAITDAVPFRDAFATNQFLRGRQYGFLNEIGKDRALLLGIYESVRGRKSTATGKRLENRYNCAALRQPGDLYAPWTVYRKVYLIPFGETMPFGLFEDRLPQNFKMEAGTLPQPLLEYRGLTFAPFVCYEAILPDHVRTYVQGKRPDVLVSLTNDSWFGDTWEPHQHLNFTRFRAVEHRAPIIRSTNTGISAFISATGDMAEGDTLGVGEEGILVRNVPILDRDPDDVTFYVRYGYHLPLVSWIVALLGWFVTMMRPPPITARD